MDRDHVGRLDPVPRANVVGAGLYLHVHDRWRHRRDDRQCRRRSGSDRYLLHRRALPLRHVARRSLRHLRGLVLLVPENDRLHVQRGSRQTPLLAHLHRHQRAVLPSALPGPRRHAAPLRRLPRSLLLLELVVLRRRLYHRGRHTRLRGRHALRLLHAAQAGRRQSLGARRDDPRMDASVAAAIPHLRKRAEVPLRWLLGGSVGHKMRSTTACGIEEDAVVNWRKECTLDVYKLVLGAFVFLSPWLFAFTYSPARLDAWGSGLLVMGLSAAAMVAFVDWEEWLALAVGLWMLAAPWVLGLPPVATKIHI